MVLMGIEENEIEGEGVDIKWEFDDVIKRIEGGIRNGFFWIFGVCSDDEFKGVMSEEKIKWGVMGGGMIMEELEEIGEEKEKVK